MVSSHRFGPLYSRCNGAQAAEMIVYGDPCCEREMGEMLEGLRAEADRCLRGDAGSLSRLDGLRTLLIDAGELEQAIADLGDPKQVEIITDCAARAFVAQWLGDDSRVMSAINELSRAIGAIPVIAGARLKVKVPEGYAFYALYPEQYCLAATRWMDDRRSTRSGPVIVVGIRSIGTSLSAVVRAMLEAHGWKAERITVRPHGHPFERHVEIDPTDVHGVSNGIVVDEGPGLSGSSMAAAAEALARAGLERGEISFMPGHGNDPGEAANGSVRAWWRDARRYVTPLHEVRWNACTLQQILADRTESLCGQPVVEVQDLSAGMWRKHACERERDWPAAWVRFERMKYRCVMRHGTAVLWKFAGLEGGAPTAAARLSNLAEKGWTVAPLGTTMGFIGRPWVEGRVSRQGEANGEVIVWLRHCIAHAAGAPMSREETNSGLARLSEMLYWNTREAIGEDLAGRTRGWADEIAETVHGLPSYGDGRVGPEEWLRTSDKRLVKVDAEGHETDHTIVGRQTILWDAAGAIVEWGLSGAQEVVLMHMIEQNIARSVPMKAIEFHRAAYAAFRLGMCELCAQSEQDVEEKRRLKRKSEPYRVQLEEMIQTRRATSDSA